MALCLEATLSSKKKLTASLTSNRFTAKLTANIPYAIFALSCPIDNMRSCFSLGGWDDDAGWDDNLGWAD